MERITKPDLPDNSKLSTLTVVLYKLNITKLSNDITIETTSIPNHLKLLEKTSNRGNCCTFDHVVPLVTPSCWSTIIILKKRKVSFEILVHDDSSYRKKLCLKIMDGID